MDVQRAFFFDPKSFPAGDCGIWDWRWRSLSVEIFTVTLWQDPGSPDRHRHLRRARFVDHEARQSDETLCMCRMSSKIHQSMPSAAACRGLYEKSVYGGVSRRGNPAARNCLRKSVLRPQGVCGKGGQLDGTRGPTEGCAYPSSNVCSRWGTNEQDIQWMVFVGKQTRCFSSMVAIGMAVQSVFQDCTRKWSLSKKQSKAGEGLHERGSLQERWIEGGRFLRRVSNWSSVRSMISKKDHCIRKR